MEEYYQIDLSREACRVEEEYSRVKEIMSKAQSVFMIDFRYEQRYKNGDKPAPAIPFPSEIESNEEKEEPRLESTFKKLRNQLAKKFHPDKDDSEESSKFKEIQEAYEEGNFSKLISTAVENEIDVKLSVSDTIAIEALIRQQKKYIEEQKETADWFWYYSKRDLSSRAKIWDAMGVRSGPFIEWLKTIGTNITAVEAESIGRRLMEKIISAEVPSKNTKIKPRSSTQEVGLITD